MAKKLDPQEPLRLPDKPSPHVGWGDRIQALLERSFVGAWNLIARPASNALAHGISDLLEHVEDSALRLSGGFILRALDRIELPDDVREDVKRMFSGTEQAGLGPLAGFGAQMGMGAASGLLAPLFRMLNYEMDKDIHSARFDPAAIFAGIRRFPDMANTLLFDGVQLGWDENRLLVWEAITRPTVPDGTLLSLWHRFPDQRSQIEQELFMRGWTPERINRLKQASVFYPGVQDLILFAVREVFDPEIVSRFGLGAEFPTEFANEAAKLGMPQELAESFWRSHWRNPSLQSGFEMFHRLRDETSPDHFGLEDLQTLIKVQDYSPYWRNKLIEIAYRPFTRVDVRRMFRAGVLEEWEVKPAYQDIGYDENKAQKLADFAMQDAFEREREVTRAAIERQYRRRIITRDVAKQHLRDIRYGEFAAEFFLVNVDLQIVEDDLAEEFDRLEFLYIEGEVTDQEVHTQLGRFNLPSEQVNRRIEVWSIRRRKKIALPAITELEDYYLHAIIELPELAEQLRKKRWSDQRILWRLERLDQRSAELTAKEAERAQRELERIAQADRRTQYQVDKAELDVELALVRLDIADLKLARHDMPDDETLAAVRVRIDELKADIATLNLRKAEIRRVLFSE